MPDIYIDSAASGANNGSSWADAYTSFEAGIEAATSGQVVWVASTSDETSISGVVITFADGVEIYSVNKTTDAYEKGATFTIDNGGSGLDLDISNAGVRQSWNGIILEVEDTISIGAVNATVIFNDCTLRCLGTVSGNFILMSTGDGAYFEFNSTVFVFNNVAHDFYVGNGSTAVFRSCTGSGTLQSGLFDNVGNGGTNIEMYDCDLSTMVASSGNLFSSPNIGEDAIRVRLSRCKLPTSFVVNGVGTYRNLNVSMISCSDGDGYYYSAEYNDIGVIDTDTSTYLNATYDGTNGFSALLEPNANSSIGNPLRHKLCEIPAQDLSSSVDVTVEFTCASTLTDTEFWLEVVHPDATDNALGVTVSTRNSDILATGTTHTPSSETWEVGKTNTYKDTATIPALTGVTNGTLEVYVCLADPTAAKDVWVDPAVTVA